MTSLFLSLESPLSAINKAIMATLDRIAQKIDGSKDKPKVVNDDGDDARSALQEKVKTLEEQLAHAATHNKAKMTPLVKELQRMKMENAKQKEIIEGLERHVEELRQRPPHVVSVPTPVILKEKTEEDEGTKRSMEESVRQIAEKDEVIATLEESLQGMFSQLSNWAHIAFVSFISPLLTDPCFS